MPKQQSRRRTLKQLATVGAAAALPAGLGACAPKGKDAQVIVIGAGLAGLNAAVLLQDQGFDVLVLEGSQRIGGRVYTLDDQPHKPDAGGSEFSVKSYARILDMVARLDLETIPWRGADVQFAFHVNGQTVTVDQWPASSANLVQGKARNVPPMFLRGMYMPQPSPLSDLNAWLESPAAAYDVPFGEFLKSAGADPEAQRLIASRAEGDSLDDISALWLMRSAKFSEVSGGIETLRCLKGGMSRLTDGMADLLNRPVATGVKVTAMHTDDAGVEIRDAAGKVWRADHAVCTTPLPLLRQITLSPSMPALQAAAVQEIPYGHHIEVFYDVIEAYWEEDGLPRSIWTDGPLGMCMNLPGDTPAGYLWLPISGQASSALQNLPEAEVLRRVTAELERVRPSTRGCLRPMTVHNWSTHPWTQGHLAYRSPGQITEFGAVLAEPHGRLHFAGEHTSMLAGGMEGAMESGERAAAEILTASI